MKKKRGLLIQLLTKINKLEVVLDTGAQANFIGSSVLNHWHTVSINKLDKPIQAHTASNISHQIQEEATVKLPAPFNTTINFLILPHLQFAIIGKPQLTDWCYNLSPLSESVTINGKTILVDTITEVKCSQVSITDNNKEDIEQLKQELREKYRNLFDLTPRPPPPRSYKYKLETYDEIPIRLPVYQANPVEKQIIEKFIETNLAEGVLCQGLPDSWLAPVIAIQQKNGDRVVSDFRKLNEKTVGIPTHLGTVKELLVMLHGATIFSVLDLRKAFYQLEIHPDSIHKLGLNTHIGVFNYTRVPFGLKNSPYLLTTFLREILGFIPNIFVYMDDIILFSRKKEDHIKLLHTICQILDNNGLQMNIEKLQLVKKEVKFIGYIIGNDSIRPTEDKLEAIKNWTLPTTTTQLRSYLAFINFFHFFLYDVASKTAILTKLYAGQPKNVKITHTEESKLAFAQLKQQLLNLPTLHLFDPNQPVHIFSDALDLAIGGIITQVRTVNNTQILVPIAFASFVLNLTQSRYLSLEKELLAICTILHKFAYTLSKRIIIYSDHESIASLQSKSTLPPRRVRRFLDVLGAYSPSIYYIPGDTNYLADLLLRYRTENITSTIDETAIFNSQQVKPAKPITKLINTIALDNLTDSQIERIRSHLVESQPPVVSLDSEDDSAPPIQEDLPSDAFCIINDALHVNWNKRLIKVVSEEEFQTAAKRIHEIHHSSIRITDYILTKSMWHPSHILICTYVVRHCQHCQLNQSILDISRQLMPLPPTNAFDTWAMDFTAAPHQDQEYRVILTAIEYVTGLGYALPCKSENTQAVLSLLTLTNQAHGTPKTLLSDNGAAFISQEAMAFYNEWSINKTNSSLYHPRSNGRCEKFNHLLKKIMRGLTNNTWSNWLLILPRAVQIYNMLPLIFDMSPYYLAYGINADGETSLDTRELVTSSEEQPPPSHDPMEEQRISLMLKDDHVLRLYQLDNLMTDREEHTSLKKRRQAMRNLVKGPYGNPATFTKGQWIFKRNRKTKKNQSNYTGPFQIYKVLPHGAYMLQNAAGYIQKGTYNHDWLVPCFAWEDSPIHALSQFNQSLREVEQKWLDKLLQDDENNSNRVNALKLDKILEKRKLLDIV